MAPNVTYKQFLQALKDDLAAEYTTAQVRISGAPWAKPYDKPAIYIIPDGPEYEPAESVAQTPENRVYRVWYHAKVTGLVAITDTDLENSIMSLGAKQGIVELMEAVYQHLEGNFLSLAYIREARVEWERPAFEPAVLESELNNWYAMIGTINYRIRLRSVEEVAEQNTPPTISNVHSGTAGVDFVCITFDTDETSTPRVKYGTSSDSSTWTDYEDGTESGTTHGVMLEGLEPNTTYYYKPWALDTTSLWGATPAVYSFTTADTNGGAELYASDFEFTVTRTAITVGYTSSLDCTCKIFMLVDGVGELQVNESVEHASPHSHQITGLTEATTYYLQIVIGKAGYDNVTYPGSFMYFVVKTADAQDENGGLKGIIYSD